MVKEQISVLFFVLISFISGINVNDYNNGDLIAQYQDGQGYQVIQEKRIDNDTTYQTSTYNSNFYIKLNDKIYYLPNALEKDLINVDDIVKKAREDFTKGKVELNDNPISESLVYDYDDYYILVKSNKGKTISVYFGTMNRE